MVSSGDTGGTKSPHEFAGSNAMIRVLAFVACGIALAACASGTDAFKVPVATATLQFESEPAGAEVKLSTGQTCRTPCALAVPAADLTANYTLTGYQPQSVPVKVVPPDVVRPDSEGDSSPGAIRFEPSPVFAVLTKAAPARKPVARRPPPPAPDTQATAPTSQPAPPPPAMRPAAPAASSPWPPAPPPPAQVR
jgi:hypothetical protein